MKFKSAFAILSSTLAIASFSYAQTTLSIGDIGITGFNANAPDGLTFVLYRDVATGTVIKFTDNAFLSSGSANATNNGRGGENFVTWTAPSGGLTAGSVVQLVNTSGSITTVTGGGTATLALSGLASGGDQIFIYQGPGTGASAITSDYGNNVNPSTFTGAILYGLTFQGGSAATTWLSTGTTSSNTSYLPSQLAGLSANIALSGSTTNGQYTGAITGLTATAYAAAVSNPINWTTQTNTPVSTITTLSTSSFTIDSSSSFNWDANGATAGDGGAGTWDTATQNLFKNGVAGTTRFRWIDSTSGNDHTAIFGGTAGTVNLGTAGVTTSGLIFDTTGYTIASNTLTFVGSSPTISVANSSDIATVSSVIAGSNGLIKSGNGTLNLSGNNNFSGATSINAGSFIISGSNTGSSLTTVASGATFGGNGSTTAALTLNGILSPGIGAGSIASLAAGTTTWNDGSVWNFDLAGGSSSSDQLTITGDFTKGSAGTYQFDFMGSTPTVHGTVYTLAAWNGATTFNQSDFSFTNLGGAFGAPGNTSAFLISGNSLTFTAVPEPSSALAGILLTAGLLRRKRVTL